MQSLMRTLILREGGTMIRFVVKKSVISFLVLLCVSNVGISVSLERPILRDLEDKLLAIPNNVSIAYLCIIKKNEQPDIKNSLLKIAVKGGMDWNATDNEITQIKDIIKNKGDSRRDARFVWVKVNQQGNEEIVGLTEFLIGADKKEDVSRMPGKPFHDIIQEQGDNKREVISQYQEKMSGKKDQFYILFDEDLRELYRSPGYQTQGNPIYVSVLYRSDTAPKFSIEFSPCSLQSANPAVLIHDQSILSSFQSEAGIEYKTHDFPPRACWNDLVTIKVASEDTVAGNINKLETSFIINQYVRYRATLQLGVLFSSLQEVNYGLRTEGEKNYIYNQGPENNGPTYAVSLILYSMPKNLMSLFGGSAYKGRDIVNDWAFFDRIGGIVGVDITKPTRRFITGLSFDVIYGVSIFLVREWARVRKLADVEEGDVFTGKLENIPIRDYWNSKWSFGISLDLRYVTALLQRK